VIIDASGGDIGSTAVAYGDAFLGPRSPFGATAAHPQRVFGLGSLAPIFAHRPARRGRVFVVVRSSNPEGSALQQARLPDGRSVAEAPRRMTSPRETWPRTERARPDRRVVGGNSGAGVAGLADRLPKRAAAVPASGLRGRRWRMCGADSGSTFAGHPSIYPAASRGGPAIGDPGAPSEREIAEIRRAA